MFNGVQILDYEGFGQRIREWANGVVPLPVTVGDLRKGDYPGLVAIANTHKDNEPLDVFRLKPNPTISIVIPDKADIVPPPPSGAYEVPRFYADLVNFAVHPPVVKEPTQTFQSARLADYAFGKCL
jgi:hypothetical protein